MSAQKTSIHVHMSCLGFYTTRYISEQMRCILDTKGMIAQIFGQRSPATAASCFRLEFHDVTGREEALRTVRETTP